MSQSFSQIYVHLIFHIKNEQTCIRKTESAKLYSYISGIIKQQGSVPLLINGMEDHLHIFCILSKNMALYKLVQEIKQDSSRWIKSLGSYYRNFEWQRGYGAFSVSPSIVPQTKRYIENQQEHHRKRSFKEEYVLFLKEYGIDYNENYLWL